MKKLKHIVLGKKLTKRELAMLHMRVTVLRTLIGRDSLEEAKKPIVASLVDPWKA